MAATAGFLVTMVEYGPAAWGRAMDGRRRMRAAYWQDPDGPWGSDAVARLAGDVDEAVGVATPSAALEALANRDVDVAVVPLEHASAGMRRDVVDHLLFVAEDLRVVDAVEVEDGAARWVRVVRGNGVVMDDAARTLVFVVPAADRPGTLTQLLAAFTARGINLSRLETRPLGALGMYGFLLEIDDLLTHDHVRDALADVHAVAQVVKVLGTVPAPEGTAFGAVAGRAVVGPVVASPADLVASPSERVSVHGVGVVGLGLIGGSLALDLLASGAEVVGTDVDADTRRAAAAAGVTVVDDVEAVARRCRVVVVATPVGLVPDTVRRVLDAAPDVVVTDVGSVKADVVAALADAPRFVAGHPMAGTERSGFDGARTGLLAGAPWIVAPTEATDVAAVAAVLELVLAVDARPTVVTGEQHDRVVALVSHAPHLLAFALHATALRAPHDALAVAGPSFRDATRVAASDPTFWADLLGRNREAVREVVADLGTWLADTVAVDDEDLRSRLVAARRDPVTVPPDLPPVEVALGDGGDGLERLRRLGAEGRTVTAVHRTGDVVRVVVGE